MGISKIITCGLLEKLKHRAAKPPTNDGKAVNRRAAGPRRGIQRFFGRVTLNLEN